MQQLLIKLSGYVKILTVNKNYLLLWLSQLCNEVAVSVTAIIIGILSDEGTFSASSKESVFGIGIIIILQSWPALFIGPIAGVISDWFDRRKLIQIANISRLVILALFIVFKGWESLTLSYFLVFIMAAFLQVYIPANGALIPQVVNKKYLLLAQSIFSISIYSIWGLGILLAGPALAIFGISGSFMFVGAVLFLSLFSIQLIKIKPEEEQRLHEKVRSYNIFKVFKEFYLSLKEIFKFIKDTKSIQFTFLHLIFVQSIISSLISMVFRIASEVAGVTARTAGAAVILPIALGLVASFIIMNTYFKDHKREQLAMSGTLIFSLGLFVLAALGTVRNYVYLQVLHEIILVSGLSLIGFSIPFMIIPAQTLLFESTSHANRGRILGVWVAIIIALGSLPSLLVGYITDRLGSILNMLIIIAALCLCYSLILYKNRKTFVVKSIAS